MSKRHRFTRVLAVAVLVLAAAVLTTEAVAASRGGAVVKLGQSGLGRIIVDSHGKTLYLWGHDKRGKSSCNGTCASAWPPLVTHGKPRAISGARMALLGTTRRADGRTQVTYHGHPLYYFVEDKRPGQTAGAGLNAFGGRFDPVSASGTALRKPAGDSDNGRKGPHATLEHGVLVVKGSKASDKITLRLEAGQPGTLQVDVGDDGSAEFGFKRADIASIAVDGRRGDDFVRIDEGNGIFTDSIPTTLDGGEDNDTLAGGSGAETLIGGDGNDFVDGNRGADVALMGAGDDTFQWDPGDGSDVVEGQDGADTMLFNGANISEKFDLSANGSRLRFTRDIATITMDTAGVETVDVKALGGLDTITVNDLAGTDVNRVNADLGAQGGGGDAAADRVVVNGSNGNDAIQIAARPGETQVSGLAATVAVAQSEPTLDTLAVNGLGGDDRIAAEPAVAQLIAVLIDGGDGTDTAVAQGSEANDALQIFPVAPAVGFAATGANGFVQALSEKLLVDALGGDDSVTAANGLAPLTQLTIDGGAGNDVLLGGDGNDLLRGGDGNDFVDGNRGADVALMGAGDDTFQWDPGDGSDVVEGQDGADTMLFNGANISEKFDLSANGSRLRFTRDIATITMDTAGVETVDVKALGGLDTITVNDLAGTDVNRVNADLGAQGGGGDAAADRVVVNGSNGNDAIDVSGDAGGIKVSGLAATVELFNAEAANDRLEINTLDGADTVNSAALAPGVIQLFVDGVLVP